MIRISTKGRYGARLMIDLANHGQQGPVSIMEIAKRQCLSRKYLERLVPPLKKAKLVRTVQGLHGGLILVKPADKITLKDIVEALEGPVCLVNCTHKPGGCLRNKNCPTRDVWDLLTKVMVQAMSRITLQEMAKGFNFGKKFVVSLN